jgi:hypothetical protein
VPFERNPRFTGRISYDAPNSSDGSFTIRFDFDKDLIVFRVYQKAISLLSDSHSEPSVDTTLRDLLSISTSISMGIHRAPDIPSNQKPIYLTDVIGTTHPVPFEFYHTVKVRKLADF